MTQTIRLLLPLCASAALLLAGDSIPTQSNAFVIDPGQTKVEFNLGDVLHTVHGTFQLKRGNLRFDPATGAASGELVVDATTGDSGSSARDRKMHANILESSRYPEIVFRPDRIDGTVAARGRSQVQLHGLFAIHGAEHEILFPVTVEAHDGQYNVEISFSVPYVKWGMKNPSTLILRVSNKVDISIQTVAHATVNASQLR